ncbi:phosphotransferases [Striga asiatica]|uniref:Phosphotransferases n=1 Tax=Striga asiatica TaxID=4170 RepID=A0A5A7RCH9_STRAF|nr:phosphotransferases [Striga asiatica]
MALANASLLAFGPLSSHPPSPSSSPSYLPVTGFRKPPFELTGKRNLRSNFISTFALKIGGICEAEDLGSENDDNGDDDELLGGSHETETFLYSFSPLNLLLLAALPGATTVTSLFSPFVELIKSWNLPDWLVHWGHPGNMTVVLFAMGGYGTYLGFRIRLSNDVEEKAKAKDLHPKLLGGMFFFFALGATGGVISLLTSDKPIFESPHAVTAFIGLALLTIQTILPALFEGNPGLRNVHGILGSGIMTLFLVHAALGLQLGLSY